MNAENILLSVTGVCYATLFLGIIFVSYERIQLFLARLRMRHRLRSRSAEYRETIAAELWLRAVLSSSIGRAVSPSFFLGGLCALFLILFVLCFKTFTLVMSIRVSLAAVSLPCLLLFIKASTMQQKGSQEGEYLLSNLLRYYRISNFNICEAIERTLQEESELRITRKHLFSLLLQLRASGDKSKMKNACDEFSYLLGTNWGRMLAHNIAEAAVKGSNVSLALEDIQIQLREARTAAEERKRLNGESLRMTCLLVPILYLVTVAMSLWYLELPLFHFFKNQFGTREGLVFFLLISFLFVADQGFLTLVLKQKYDY